MKRCVVTVGAGQRFPLGVRRLEAGLAANGFDGESRMFTDYPPGCPTHKQIPYGFKPWVMEQARRDGFDQVLWIDADCVPVRPLDGLFNELALEGAILPYSPQRIWQWCSDACAKQMGIPWNKLRGLCPSIWSCVMGLDFRHDTANEFLDQWLAYSRDGVSFHGSWRNDHGEASVHPEVKGHRHDQTVATILAFRLGLPFSLSAVSYDMEGIMPFEDYDKFLRLPDCRTYILNNDNVKTQDHPRVTAREHSDSGDEGCDGDSS